MTPSEDEAVICMAKEHHAEREALNRCASRAAEKV
jgi:hypothetical protein